MMNVADFEEKLSALPDDLKPDIVLLQKCGFRNLQS